MSAHKFADDNILSSFTSSVKLLLETLIAEFEYVIKCFSDNKIIVNPDKFKSITVQKSNQKVKAKQFLIQSDVVEMASSVKLLGIHKDDQINFNLHSSNMVSGKKTQKKRSPQRVMVRLRVRVRVWGEFFQGDFS